MPTDASSGSDSAPSTGMSRGLVLLFAVACGLSVANLYYAQPILDTIARSFGASPSTAGLVVTLSQVGYALGLALLVPLGDLLTRRRLLPMAASLADEEHRGQVVGMVMSGLLLGILLARTVSGIVAQVAGWRSVYVLAAGIAVALTPP